MSAQTAGGQRFGVRVVRVLDTTVDMVTAIILTLLLLLGCYALWDSQQVYDNASSVSYAEYKPTTVSTEGFQELQAANPDVFGWLEVYGTNIDYPLVQADDNTTYLNVNAKGEYSLTGALFLDYANDRHFADFNSIIYGHHLEKEVMFGEIGNFENEEFFDEHRYGNLYYDGADHGIEFFAFVLTDAYDSTIYTVVKSNSGQERAYVDGLLSQASRVRDVEVSESDHIVLLSTCSTDSTNGRDILVGKITDQTYPDTSGSTVNAGTGITGSSGGVWTWALALPWWIWTVLLLLALLLMLLLSRRGRRRKNTRDEETDDGAYD